MSGYEEIKRLSKETGRKIPELIALARQNDPFFVGSPAQIEKGEWFARMWEEHGYVGMTGIHLRRVHYKLYLTEEEVVTADGNPYENTEECWKHLCEASKYARYLDLVDADAFEDRRGLPPKLNMHVYTPEEPDFEYDFPEWLLPKIRFGMRLDSPHLYPTQYHYEPGLQPYHVEVWAEKSTMNDVLVPLCVRQNANFVTGVGQMSISEVRGLLRRTAELGKPCRILYLSDFDPAGESMPTAVARKVEFEIRDLPNHANVRLDPVVLSQEQVTHYNLPRKPMTGKAAAYKDGWEARHGAGAVELDAVEAMHPGELARLCEERICCFRDPDLRRKISVAGEEAEEEIAETWQAVAGHLEKRLEELRESIRAVVDRYRPEIEHLDAAMQAELASYLDELESVRLGVQAELDTVEPELPPLPEPQTPPEPDGWLYDSSRCYMEQLEAYKHRQNGDAV